MKLTTYIDLYYQGNKSAFARAMDVQPPSVHQWLNSGAEIIGGKLVLNYRDLPPSTSLTDVYDAHVPFEAMMRSLNPAIPLERDGDGYKVAFVHGAWMTFCQMKDTQPEPVIIPYDALKSLQVASEAIAGAMALLDPEGQGTNHF